MKALVWEGPRVMALRDQDVPEPGPGEVLLKVGYAGICGSELSGYLGHNSLRVPPLVMGHEFSGEIIALGDGAAEQGLAVGQQVTVNPLSCCGDCDNCHAGENQLCSSRKLIGAHRPGAYADYVLAHADGVIPLPDGLAPRLAALAEPVAVGVRIAELAGETEGHDFLIVGGGPIGLLALQALQLRGAGRVFLSESVAERRAMAEELGAEVLDPAAVDVVKTVRDATGGRGVPASVDAVGTATTRAVCISATRAGGLVIFSGLHEETIAIPAADIIRREIIIRGSFAYNPANFRHAVDLLAANKIRLDPWIVEAPLSEGGAWFDRLLTSPAGVSKVLLIPGA